MTHAIDTCVSPMARLRSAMASITTVIILLIRTRMDLLSYLLKSVIPVWWEHAHGESHVAVS